MPALKAYINSTWTDIGFTGTDEVYVGPDQPAAGSGYELWYDTDASAPGWVQSEIFYSQITATLTITGTSVATATSIINPGNVNYDGTPVWLEFYCDIVSTLAGAQAELGISLFDGNTDLGFWTEVINPSTTRLVVPVFLRRRITPTAGAHNYNVRGWLSGGGTGTAYVFCGPGSTVGQHQPAYLRAERV